MIFAQYDTHLLLTVHAIAQIGGQYVSSESVKPLEKVSMLSSVLAHHSLAFFHQYT